LLEPGTQVLETLKGDWISDKTDLKTVPIFCALFMDGVSLKSYKDLNNKRKYEFNT
jgi:hypothetical protein